MYKRADLIPVQIAISSLSEMHGVPEDLIRSEIRTAIDASRSTSDSTVQEQRSSFECNCMQSSEDEFITWLAKKVIAMRLGLNQADTAAME